MALTQEGAIKIAAKHRNMSVEAYLEKIKLGEKWCYKCKSWKRVTDFAIDRSRGDQHKVVCFTCDRVKEPQRVKEKKVKVPKVREPKIPKPKSKKTRKTVEGGLKLATWKRAARQIGISLEEYTSHINNNEYWDAHSKVWRLKDKSKRPLRTSAMKGKHFSEEARGNMGRKKGFVSEKKGIPRTLQERAKISRAIRKNSLKGEGHPNYKHGNSKVHQDIRKSSEYGQWRYDVFLRDKFTCQHCGDIQGGNLNAHHIKSFAEYPMLRFDIDNGITLCEKCHNKVHFKADSTRNKRRAKRQERQIS